jgi:hypothetical protein
MTQEDPALERARKHVKDVRDFYYHLMTYVLVNALLVIVDLRGGPGGDFLGLDFAYWLILFWGFGIAGHAISVFYGEYRVQRLYEQEKDREHGSR